MCLFIYSLAAVEMRSPWATLSVMRKNLFLMCLLFFPELIFQLITRNIVDLLSWYRIFLEKNGRMSAEKNSKHIKNRFFLITDKVAQGDLKIEYKGTDEMWGDVNTKTTQGKKV